MLALFGALGQDRGFPIGYAERISKLVPEAILRLPCFLDRLTGIWRYEYGEPITFKTGRTIVGTPMFPEVERLFDVLGCADWRISGEKLQAYLTRLSDPLHHEDALVEFAPILRLSDGVSVQHEVNGNQDDASTVDWVIEAPGEPTLFLEVKNRIRDLIESFEAIDHLEKYDEIPAPTHDHSILFKSVERKFKPRRPDDAIQGVWIKSELMQESTEFRTAFEALEAARVHVAILGDWGEDTYVVAADNATKKKVLKILRLKQSKRLVFDRRSALRPQEKVRINAGLS